MNCVKRAEEEVEEDEEEEEDDDDEEDEEDEEKNATRARACNALCLWRFRSHGFERSIIIIIIITLHTSHSFILHNFTFIIIYILKNYNLHRVAP